MSFPNTRGGCLLLAWVDSRLRLWARLLFSSLMLRPPLKIENLQRHHPSDPELACLVDAELGCNIGWTYMASGIKIALHLKALLNRILRCRRRWRSPRSTSPRSRRRARRPRRSGRDGFANPGSKLALRQGDAGHPGPRGLLATNLLSGRLAQPSGHVK